MKDRIAASPLITGIEVNRRELQHQHKQFHSQSCEI